MRDPAKKAPTINRNQKAIKGVNTWFPKRWSNVKIKKVHTRRDIVHKISSTSMICVSRDGIVFSERYNQTATVSVDCF